MRFLQMSLAGAVMILAITVIRALAINRVPKTTFLVLWGTALARLLIPFSLPSAWSIYALIPPKPTSAATVTTILPTLAIEPDVSSSAITPTIPMWNLVWLAGMLLFAALFLIAYWRSIKEFQMSIPVENDAARSWLKAHPLRRRVAIRQSDRITSPLTFGVLHPVILMPKTTDWTDERTLPYVLEHEFVHIRRFDALTKLLLTGAVCVHWFNPLVWVMYLLANRDLELSCDACVVRHFGASTRAAYAHALIHMEETRSGFNPLCSNFSKNAMEERILAIMKTKKLTVISLFLAIVLVTGTLTVFATSADADSQAPAAVSGTGVQSDAELLDAGLTYQGSTWFYQGRAVAGMYDDNGGIYTNDVGENGIYLHVQRDNQHRIADFALLSRMQFRELVDAAMNVPSPKSAAADETLSGYTTDGQLYGGFGDATYAPMADEQVSVLTPMDGTDGGDFGFEAGSGLTWESAAGK